MHVIWLQQVTLQHTLTSQNTITSSYNRLICKHIPLHFSHTYYGHLNVTHVRINNMYS